MLVLFGRAFERTAIVFMLKFCTVLFLAALVCCGVDASRICITDSGVSFGGHAAAGACDASAHEGLMAIADTVGNCGQCVDVAVGEVEQSQAQDAMRALHLEPVWLLLAVMNEGLHTVSPLRIETFYDTVADAAGTKFFNPLSTIVLRI